LHRFVAVATRLDPLKQARLSRISKISLGCVLALYFLECVSVWCAVGYLAQGAAMMPATASNERSLVRVFNSYTNAYAFSFVFESACMVTILGLFALGYSVTLREFKNVEHALHLASQKSKNSGMTAKAHVLEQGVHEMSAILTATTAVVFCSFVIQTSYDLLWTTATFGDVFKVQCKRCCSKFIHHNRVRTNQIVTTDCAGVDPCDDTCYDRNGVLNHAIRFTTPLVALVYFTTMVVSPCVAILGMAKGKIW
jgi:hypothetical protein